MPPRSVAVPMKFLTRGVRYDELSEHEKDDWDSAEWNEDGVIPDHIPPSELNKYLFNADTVDKVLEVLVTRGYRVVGGDRLGKTIIFARNAKHAEFVKERYDLNYPWQGGAVAKVIVHGVSHVQTLIDDFSTPEKQPDIAISVDILDTGVDMPEACNLVFFKPVYSRTKFWQMIGRGTRLRPDLFGPGEHKSDFLVFDFCGNLEYFSAPDAGVNGSLQKSLSQRLFETRLALVAGLDAQHAETQPARRNHRRTARHRHRDEPRQLPGPSAPGMGPEVVRGATLEGDQLTVDRLRTRVQAIAANLLGKTAIPAVAAELEILGEVGVVLPGVTVGTNLERFRAKVRAWLTEHDDLVALQKLRRSRQLTSTDLDSLHATLLSAGVGSISDLERAATQAHGLGLFVRSLVGLDRAAAMEAFTNFLENATYSAGQLDFLNLIVEHLTANGTHGGCAIV